MGQVSESAVCERSYFIWLAEGRPHGRDLEHWFRAMAELEAGAGLEPTAVEPKPTPRGRAGRAGKAAKTSAGKKVGAKGRSPRATRT